MRPRTYVAWSLASVDTLDLWPGDIVILYGIRLYCDGMGQLRPADKDR